MATTADAIDRHGATEPGVQEFLRRDVNQLLIDGQWRAPVGGAQFSVVNPTNASTLASVTL